MRCFWRGALNFAEFSLWVVAFVAEFKAVGVAFAEFAAEFSAVACVAVCVAV